MERGWREPGGRHCSPDGFPRNCSLFPGGAAPAPWHLWDIYLHRAPCGAAPVHHADWLQRCRWVWRRQEFHLFRQGDLRHFRVDGAQGDGGRAWPCGRPAPPPGDRAGDAGQEVCLCARGDQAQQQPGGVRRQRQHEDTVFLHEPYPAGSFQGGNRSSSVTRKVSCMRSPASTCGTRGMWWRCSILWTRRIQIPGTALRR